MLDEISDKFAFVRTYLQILEQPFYFPARLDVGDKAIRKASWKFFFYSAGLAAAASTISAKVVSARHAELACPALREAIDFSGKRVSLLLIVILFSTVLLTHLSYKLFRKAQGKSLTEYAPLMATVGGFLVITSLAIVVPQAFAMDRMLQDYGSDILNQCGVVTLSVQDVEVTVQNGNPVAAKPNFVKHDPFGSARDSSEYKFIFWSGIASYALDVFALLMFVSWTARYYDSSFRFALFMLVISSIPLAVVEPHASEYFESVNEILDSLLPDTIRGIVRTTFGL